MMQLISHTEYLLSIHECVIIPGLGGFLTHTCPAYFDEANSTWNPPHKQLSFNSSLFHNDGLLLASYAETHSITYSESFVFVEKAVLELKKELQVQKEVKFGRVGSFLYDEHGALLFSPAEIQPYFSSSTYGLPSIKMPLLTELKKTLITYPDEQILVDEKSINKKDNVVKHPVKKSDTIYIPLKKNFIYRSATIAAVVLLAMLFSTPIYVDNTRKTDYAKILAPFTDNNTSVVEKEEVTEYSTTAPSTAEIINPSVVTKTELSKEDNTIQKTEKIASSSPVVNNEKKQPTKILAQNNNIEDKFFIIIGSFPSNKDAQSFQVAAQANGLKNANILVRDGRYRVYAESFNNSSEASQYMKSFRDQYQSMHPNAWLYKK